MTTSNKHTDTPKGNNYIFAIAIDEYQDEHISNLKYAVSDAEYLVEVLKCKYGFEDSCKGQSLMLTNAEATQDNIHKLFVHLIKSLEPDDNLVIYLAGHATQYPYEEGDQYKDGAGNFVTYETPTYSYEEKLYPDSFYAISTELLVSYFVQMKAHDVYLIADVNWSDKILDSKPLIEFDKNKLGFRCGLITERELDMFDEIKCSTQEEKVRFAKEMSDFLKKYTKNERDRNFKNLLSQCAQLIYPFNASNGRPTFHVDIRENWKDEMEKIDWEIVKNDLNLPTLIKFSNEYEYNQKAKERIEIIKRWREIAKLTNEAIDYRVHKSKMRQEVDMIENGLFEKIIEDKGLSQNNNTLMNEINESIQDATQRERKDRKINFIEVQLENEIFEISNYLITVEQYKMFDEDEEDVSHAYLNGEPDDTEPVVNISWIEALRFSKWYGEQLDNSDYKYDIPTTDKLLSARRKGEIKQNEEFREWCKDKGKKPELRQRQIDSDKLQESFKKVIGYLGEEELGKKSSSYDSNLGFRITRKLKN